MQLKDLLPAGLLLNNLFDKVEKAADHADGRITTTNTKQVELGDVMFFHKDLDDLKHLLATTGSDSVTIKKLPKTDVIIVKRTASSDDSGNDAADAAVTPTISSTSPTPTTITSTSSASSTTVSDVSDISEEMEMSAKVEVTTPFTTSSSQNKKTLPEEEEAVDSNLSENDATSNYHHGLEIQPVQLSPRDTKSKTPGVFPWRNRLCRCVSIGAIFGNKDDRLAKSDEPLPPYEEGVSIFNWGNGVCKCVPMDDAFGDHTMAALGLAIETVE
ncbi:hypothetical protein COL5a_007564 [Colletotrichum fioriniae]|uniref:uncharacterized protein n=1 Tax=Colletotrichum fioriniae TaxID=710243 RepID=UPI0023013C15|nr:uncharacterized protein COL516b_009326 [Colletotrichum fioriniae]KAJ0299077.1 hypothetical protein COL516b_009326 [Colletotrichum fioriniae]KAJ0325059.1 hypothetical protein COL5a_007564 [Colletotrichum fioriniae]KAJ3942828.1 hypothetical protein N0V96_007054 [Colletotrichum fioriniae]